MKRILSLIFIVICFNGFAQTVPSVPTVKADSGYYRVGYLRAMVLGNLVEGDTAIRPSFNGATRLWYHDGVDTAIWAWHTDRWIKIASSTTSGGGGGTIDTLNLSFRIDTLAAKVLIAIYPLYMTAISTDSTEIAIDTTYFLVGGDTTNLSYRIDSLSSNVYPLTLDYIIGGYVSRIDSLKFEVSPAEFRLNGVGPIYSAWDSVTLSPADPTLNRIDVIYIDGDGNVGVIEGTPAVNPSEPQVDPAYQIKRTSVYIPAASTLPAGFLREVIYDENVEWTPTTTGTVSFSNTTNPFHLTISADMASQLVSRTQTYTKPSGTLQSTDYSLFKMYIDLKATIVAASNIQVRFYNGAVAVSTAITLSATYGFSKTDVGYQNITIPFSAFAWTSTTFNRVIITFVGVQGGSYVDWVQLQGGIPNGQSNFITDVFRKVGTDSVFQVINSVPEFAFIDSTGGGGGGGSVTDFLYTDTYALDGTVINSTTIPNLSIILDTSLILSQNHFYNSIDSLLIVIGDTYVSYSDTAAMLSGYVRRVLAGTNVTVDNTDPQYPIVSSTGGGSVTPAAMTKVDDTNVTLTLGGTPATSLLQATSLTLGWTGVLGVSRGGTSYGSYTTGDMLYASGSGTLSKLAIGSSGQHLVVVGGVPVWRDTAAVVGSAGWSTTGNAGLTAGTNFIGTTDNTDFVTKVNTVEKLRVVSSTGYYGVNTAAPTAQLHIIGGDGLPSLSAELINTANYTSTNWTTVVAGTYTHNTGNTTALTNTLAGVVGTGYRVLATVTGRTGGTFTMTFGGVTSAIITPTSGTYYAEFPLVATSTGTLSVTPTSIFDGTVTISIKSVSGAGTPIMIAANNTSGGSLEVRADTAFNLFLGQNAGARNISGAGIQTGVNDGLHNIGIGTNALTANLTGGSHIAIGYNALTSQKATHSNVAIGPFAMNTNTTGYQNISIGNATLYANTTGDNNVAIGGGLNNNGILTGPLRNNVSGRSNVAIGGERGASSFGFAGGANTASDNTFVGAGSGRLTSSGGTNTAVGSASLYTNATGAQNTAVGALALFNSTTSNNTVVGYNAGINVTSTGTIDAFGSFSGNSFTTGLRNFSFGGNSGNGTSTANTGSDNMYLGNNAGSMANSLGTLSTNRNTNVGTYSGIGYIDGANDNTFIGYATGNGTTSNATSVSGKNNIAIGAVATLPSVTSSSQITMWVGATGGTGGYNALTRFTGGGWLFNGTTSAVTSQTTGAAVEVKSTTGTFMPPVMTGVQATALGASPDGSMIYVTSTDGVFSSVGFWGMIAGTWTALHL